MLERAARRTRPGATAQNCEHASCGPRPCSAAAASRAARAAPARAGRRSSRSRPARRARRARRRRARRSAWPAPTPRAMSCVTMTIVLRTCRLDAAELAVQLAAGDRIERAERLVHQQNRRIGRERARHADALALAARQLLAAGARRSRRRQADELQQLVDPRRDPRLVPAEQPRHDGDVVANGQVRKEADLLEHVADAAPEIERVPLRDRRARARRPRRRPARAAG